MAFIDSGKGFNKEENHQNMEKKMKNLDVAQYPLRIPSDLYKQVKIKLAHEESTLREVLIAMLEEYIKK